MFRKKLAPDGQPTDMEPIMLFSDWVRDYASHQHDCHEMIQAHMGKPTYPVSDAAIQAAREYYDEVEASDTGLDYGNPAGELENRKIIAGALRTWYGNTTDNKALPLGAEEVVCTVGGADAISVLLELLERSDPKGKILLQEPWYPLYAGKESVLYPINVMGEKGYHLTAAALERSILQAEQERVRIKAVLLCDPNNPTGTCIGQDELIKIAALLDKKLPRVPVILDQAYCEMGLYTRHVSLVQVASKALRQRIVLLHSATKALSLSGERVAVAVIFDPKLRQRFLDLHVSRCGHAPKSGQYIYARALKDFCENSERQQALIQYYRPKVEYVFERLQRMGAAMPDESYRPEATFYVMADLSELINLPLPVEAEAVFGPHVKRTLDSEHVAYKLMFESYMTFAPHAYFTGKQTDWLHASAFMRITCSGDQRDLQTMMDRLERCLLQARQARYLLLVERLCHVFNKLDEAKIFDASSQSKLDKLTQAMRQPVDDIWEDVLLMKRVSQGLTEMLKSCYTMLRQLNKREGALAKLEILYPECRKRRMFFIDSYSDRVKKQNEILGELESLRRQFSENCEEIRQLERELVRRGIEADSLSRSLLQRQGFFSLGAVMKPERSRSLDPVPTRVKVYS